MICKDNLFYKLRYIIFFYRIHAERTRYTRQHTRPFNTRSHEAKALL